MERVLRLVVIPPVADRTDTPDVSAVQHHVDDDADHGVGTVRGPQESGRVHDVLSDLRLFADHHGIRHPDEALQPGHVAHGHGGIQHLRPAHAGHADAQDVGHTRVLRPFHHQDHSIVPGPGRVRGAGNWSGAADGRQSDGRQTGFAEHADGVYVVTGRHHKGRV